MMPAPSSAPSTTKASAEVSDTHVRTTSAGGVSVEDVDGAGDDYYVRLVDRK